MCAALHRPASVSIPGLCSKLSPLARRFVEHVTMDPWGKSRRKRIVETAKGSGNPPPPSTLLQKNVPFFTTRNLFQLPLLQAVPAKTPSAPTTSSTGAFILPSRSTQNLLRFFLAASTSAWSGWHGSLTAAPMPRRLKKSTPRNASVLRQKRAQWR